MKKESFYTHHYTCEEEIENCIDCFWYNGEQCIRQLLTEEDVEDIENKNEF